MWSELKRLPKLVQGSIVKDPFFFLTTLVAIVFSVIFSWYSIVKYLSLNATTFDLGLNANILWNTLHGQLFYSDLLGGSFRNNLMAEHFSPFRAVGLIFYYIYPSPISILVFQDTFLSISVIPLYLVTKKILNERVEDLRFLGAIPFALAISYELSPFVGGIYSFDYHMTAFLPFFLFMAILCFLYNRKAMNILMLAFIVSLHSNFVYIAAMVVLFEIYYSIAHGEKGLMFSSLKSRVRIAASIVIILLIFYYYAVLAGYLKGVIAGTPSLSLSPGTYSTGSPSGSIIGLATDLFRNPSVLLQYLLANHSAKEQYISLLFSTTGYLSFLYPETLIMGIPYAIYAMFSYDYAYYALGLQYNAMIFPVVFLGASFGAARVLNYISKGFAKREGREEESTEKTKRNVMKYVTISLVVIIVVSCASGFTYDPIAPPQIFTPSNAMSNIGEMNITGETSFLLSMVKKIPENAYILAQNNIGPFFSNFRHVFMAPYSIGNLNVSQYSMFDYIVLTYDQGWGTFGPPSATTVAAIELAEHKVGIWAEYENSLLILKKGYNGTVPEYYVKTDILFHPSSFSIVKGSIVDGKLVENNVSGELWFGPYTVLYPGNYSAEFIFYASSLPIGGYITLDISSYAGSTIISTETVKSSSFNAGSDTTVTINFNITAITPSVEFRAVNSEWNGTLEFLGVRVSETSL